MTNPKPVSQIPRESIAGLRPCPVYRGYATAIETRAGTQIVLLGANQDDVIRIAGQINPRAVLDPKLIVPAIIAHEAQVIEMEKDL